MADPVGVYNEASRYYQSPLGGYYPGSTVAGMTPTQQQGYQTGIQAVTGYQPIAQNVADRSSEYMRQIIPGGGMLGSSVQAVEGVGASFDPYSNPALQGAIDAMRSSARTDFERGTGAYLGQGANAAGQRGSSRQAIVEGLARSDLEDTLAEKEAQMRSAGYSAGLDRYVSDRGTTLDAAQQYQRDLVSDYGENVAYQKEPYLAQTELSDRLGEYGLAQQAINQARMQEEKDRYDYTRDEPYNRLANYVNLLSGAPGSGTTSTVNTTTPANSGYSRYLGPVVSAVGDAAGDWISGIGTQQNANIWGTTPGSQQTQMLQEQWR